MILFVIFGQRKETYPGQYAPEALEVMDEYGMEDNPEWLEGKLDEHKKDTSFVNVEIIEINLGSNGQEAIRERLSMPLKIEGTV
jgi:hypothetical protein